jgi:hypothetical protein
MKPGGEPSSAFVLSIANLRRALPSLARCDRPRNALSIILEDQPGRFAQGPEEKCGRAGRPAGFVVMSIHSFQNGRAPLGGRVPLALSRETGFFVKSFSQAQHATDAHERWTTAACVTAAL